MCVFVPVFVCVCVCPDTRIAMLMLQHEESQTMQQKYVSDLGEITIESDRESNRLRKEKRFFQDEVICMHIFKTIHTCLICMFMYIY